MEPMKILAVLCCISSIAAELTTRLRYYETLHHVDVKVRRKRSVGVSGQETKDVHFKALGRTFDLILTPGSPVVGSDFKANVMYSDGSSSPLFVNLNNFYNGHLAGDETVTADAFEENGVWTANIYDKNEIYTLEPSQPHLPKSDNHSMIVYRQSDITWESIYPDLASSPDQRTKMCGGIHAEDEPDYDPGLEAELAREEEEALRRKHNATRHKRAAPANTCHIIAVADHTFYMGPGGGFAHRTANSIIQSMQSVNNIYRNVLWNQDLQLTGLGFQIKELRIHAEYTAEKEFHKNGLHYNMEQDWWPDIDLLRQFGMDKDFNKFCLAHLFTHRRFDGGVLGLAYIASSRRGTLGGICSRRRSGGRTLNTGFSSSMNTKGNNLLTQEAVLVTTHEFGHNWGAEHDAETSECSPSAFNNGKYVMYPYAVSGYEENNKRFSPCSKRYVTEVLTAKSDRCFKEEEEKATDKFQPDVPMCGNGRVDLGEECDGGGMGLSGMDPCCSADCKFIGDAICSSVNFECCQDCKEASRGTPCRGESRELCRMAAFCSGFSKDCPQSRPMDNNTKCIDGGKCILGECMDYCEYEGKRANLALFPCRCEEQDSACLRCCRTKDGECSPRGNEVLMDGRPCNFGYCETGVCKEGKGNTIQRLFTFIETLDSSTLVAFMKSNIVGTVIVFSLVVWIPASWAISCVDKRNEKRSRERELAWVSNDVLLNQSLQSNMLNNRFEDYKVKESDYHRSTGRPLLGRGDDGGGADFNGGGRALKLQPPPKFNDVSYRQVPRGNNANKPTEFETRI